MGSYFKNKTHWHSSEFRGVRGTWILLSSKVANSLECHMFPLKSGRTMENTYWGEAPWFHASSPGDPPGSKKKKKKKRDRKILKIVVQCNNSWSVNRNYHQNTFKTNKRKIIAKDGNNTKILTRNYNFLGSIRVQSWFCAAVLFILVMSVPLICCLKWKDCVLEKALTCLIKATPRTEIQDGSFSVVEKSFWYFLGQTFYE